MEHNGSTQNQHPNHGQLVTSVSRESLDSLLDIDRVVSQQYKLTNAETNVCGHYVRGMSYPAIAKQRRVYTETIKSQISNILLKTGCTNRSEVIALVVVINEQYRSLISNKID